MAASPSSLQFLAIGDWGSDICFDDGDRKKVSNEMTKIHKTFQTTKSTNDDFFVVTLGDNFYPYGVLSVNDSLWERDFTNAFPDIDCRWHPILGNHDWIMSPLAQVNYNADKRWQMDAMYYSKVVGDVHCIYLDTQTLCPDMSFQFIDSKVYPPIVFSLADKYEQLRWLEVTLRESTSGWVIVFGHYPIYSGGGHGVADRTVEMRELSQLLKQYKIDAYFCGHDHSLQHIYDPEKTQFHLFVNGSGFHSNPQEHPVTDMESYSYFNSTGFMHVKICDDITTINIISSEGGKILKTVQIAKQDRTVNRQEWAEKNKNMVRDERISPLTHTLTITGVTSTADAPDPTICFYDRNRVQLADFLETKCVEYEQKRGSFYGRFVPSGPKFPQPTLPKVKVNELLTTLFENGALSVDSDGYVTQVIGDKLYTMAPTEYQGILAVVTRKSTAATATATSSAKVSFDQEYRRITSCSSVWSRVMQEEQAFINANNQSECLQLLMDYE